MRGPEAAQLLEAKLDEFLSDTGYIVAVCLGILGSPELAVDGAHSAVVEGSEEPIVVRARRPQKRRQRRWEVEEDGFDQRVLHTWGQTPDEARFAGGDVSFDRAGWNVHRAPD
jgi:hypothetical protein